MTPISFSKKLLALWGASLIEASPEVPLEGTVKETPAKEATSELETMTFDENRAASAAKAELQSNQNVPMQSNTNMPMEADVE